MSYEESGSDNDYGDLFGSEDEASDIDDGRDQSSEKSSNSPLPQKQVTPPPPPQPPAATSNHHTNDMDNLFGSDDESESEPEQRQTLKQRRQYGISDDDESGQGQDDEDEDMDSQDNKKQRVEVSLEMPQLPLPYSDTQKYYLAKLPHFLDIELLPFDPDEFEVQVEEGLPQVQEQEAIREQIENTIRWRRTKEHGEESIQSNAHLVEWEDGKVSLMLGDECFDVGSKPVGTHEHVYLLAHQTGSGALESHTEFTDRMTFRPSGLKSDTHRYLTAQIADKQIKKTKTKMFFTEKDPELMKQELETLENERLRAQKKLDQKRRKTDMGFNDAGSRRNNEFGSYDTADYETYGSSSRAQDKYEDDFVVDDDDYEEEERSREDRLAQAKRAGMDRYKRSRYSDEEEEEEEEEQEYGSDDDEDEDEVVVRRHKKTRMLSDEDE